MTNYFVLTFDDGFIHHYEMAKMLYRSDMLASFYIITCLCKYRGMPLLMKRPRYIREIYDMGHEIGSHTHTHRNLTLLQPLEIEREFQISLEVLSKIIKSDIKGVAYPYGAFNDNVVSIAKKYFRYGRTIGKTNRWNEKIDPYRIGSMSIKHLIKYPFKVLTKQVRLVVLTFHDESLSIIRLIVELLKTLNVRVLPLSEALERLGVLRQ